MFSSQYEFGPYRLEVQSRMLFREGIHVALSPKVAELLVALVQAAGRMLTREELLQQLWPDTVVEEGSLTSHISLLRKALGEGQRTQDFIETLSKRGYRFVAPVKRLESVTHDGAPDRTMLVVLPFENLSAGEKYDYFSDGLTEEMITELARLSPERLGVIARTSAMQFKSTRKTSHRSAASWACLMSWRVRCAGQGSVCASRRNSSGSAMNRTCGLRVTSEDFTMCSRCRRKWPGRSPGKSKSS